MTNTKLRYKRLIEKYERRLVERKMELDYAERVAAIDSTQQNQVYPLRKSVDDLKDVIADLHWLNNKE
jgi:hypothetical protein